MTHSLRPLGAWFTRKPSTTATTASATTATATGTTGTTGTTTAALVDANTASVDQITQALTAAGVDNAAHGAKEIEEYRPYTADNLSSTVTRELGKYGIDNATLAKILATVKV